MEAKSFFGSLFDYSFSSFITPRIIKVLYVLATILIVLWTLAFVLIAFKASSGLGIVTLLIFGPIFFVLGMIYARVLLELLIVFFRIHGDVHEINRRGGGANGTPALAAPPAAPAVPPVAALREPAVTAAASAPSSDAAPAFPSSTSPAAAAVAPMEARFCGNCGAEHGPGKGFCTGCGEPLA
jgi:Domain of unknown function (DUF4282)